jgi:hypothetical protein
MKKPSKRDQIERRRALACGGFDGQDVCNGVIACQRCGLCLVHCTCTSGARVQPGAKTPAGKQLALCEQPQLTWQGR